MTFQNQTGAPASQGERTIRRQEEIFVMPEGINRASRNKRTGFPLTDCGNDDFEVTVINITVSFYLENT
jgi:hypothetical protein